MIDYLELEEKLSSVLCPVHNKTYAIKVEENGLELLLKGEKCCQDYIDCLNEEIMPYAREFAIQQEKDSIL